MITMVLEGVMKATRPPEGFSSTEAVREGIDSVKERYLHLFRVHGFTPHIISDVLQPHSIGLAELMDDAKLLHLLSEQVQAERLAVQPDWLNAKPVPPVGTSYSPELHKNPTGLCNELVRKLKQHDNQTDLTVLFVRESGADLQSEFENDTNQGGNVGVVVRPGLFNALVLAGESGMPQGGVDVAAGLTRGIPETANI